MMVIYIQYILKISGKIILTVFKSQYRVSLLIGSMTLPNDFQWINVILILKIKINKIKHKTLPNCTQVGHLIKRAFTKLQASTTFNTLLSVMTAEVKKISCKLVDVLYLLRFIMVLSGLLDTLQLKTKCFWHAKRTPAPSNIVPIITATRQMLGWKLLPCLYKVEVHDINHKKKAPKYM